MIIIKRMPIEFIHTLRRQVVLEGIFSQVSGVENAAVYVEEGC